MGKWVKRKNCLTRSTDFLRVKRIGISFSNPFMVIIAAPNNSPISRFGIAAGRSVGNAVFRNRAKRRLRSCLDELLKKINPGWDLIIYGRQRLLLADYSEIRLAMSEIMQKADIFKLDV
jgi:ribonuclease P protein component